jgi:hypothetical protein
MPDNDAVTSEFADAVGLSGLKSTAGGRAATGAGARHGSAGTAAPPPAVSNWPPPPTPEPFKIAIRQLDFVCRKLVEMTTKIELDAPSGDTESGKPYIDECADQLWPVAYVYGAGSDKPTKGVLLTYAITTLAGYAIVLYTQWKQKSDARRANAQPPLALEK